MREPRACGHRRATLVNLGGAVQVVRRTSALVLPGLCASAPGSGGTLIRFWVGLWHCKLAVAKMSSSAAARVTRMSLRQMTRDPSVPARTSTATSAAVRRLGSHKEGVGQASRRAEVLQPQHRAGCSRCSCFRTRSAPEASVV